MLRLTINGEQVEAREGQTVLEVARELSIKVPTLCYHPALTPYGGCRLCTVEVTRDGRSELTTSCDLLVEEGMAVETHSDRVLKARRLMAELLLARCPKSQVIKDLSRELGVDATRFRVLGDPEELCILCGLCVRICGEAMGVGAIGFANRGWRKEVGPPFGRHSEVCLTCGACEFICPTGAMDLKKVSKREPIPLPSEFDMGLTSRPSVYLPFPQAVPNVPVVDPKGCIYQLTGNCKICEHFCEPEAIEPEMEEEEIEVEVGTIIVATGFDQFDPNLKPEFAYGLYDNVITGLEFERLCSASGPSAGEIVVNGREPKRVVFIQCVGSRDQQVGNEYCSRVCCMYTAKHAHLLKEKVPDAEVTVFYTDVRAFGKGFEEFYDRVREEGVIYRRGNASEIYRKGGNLIVRAEDTLLSETLEVEADLVVLAAGVVPRPATREVASLLKLTRSADGFLAEAHPKLRPVDTAIDGVFLAGCCQGPKDIPDTVAQAKGAASSALVLMSKGIVTVEPITASIDEDVCSGCGICESLCEYGALSLDRRRQKMVVNEVLCKGCGACAVGCPSNAISVKSYTPQQLLAQVHSML